MPLVYFPSHDIQVEHFSVQNCLDDIWLSKLSTFIMAENLICIQFRYFLLVKETLF